MSTITESAGTCQDGAIYKGHDNPTPRVEARACAQKLEKRQNQPFYVRWVLDYYTLQKGTPPEFCSKPEFEDRSEAYRCLKSQTPFMFHNSVWKVEKYQVGTQKPANRGESGTVACIRFCH